jgi:hypothetical protein
MWRRARDLRVGVVATLLELGVRDLIEERKMVCWRGCDIERERAAARVRGRSAFSTAMDRNLMVFCTWPAYLKESLTRGNIKQSKLELNFD